MSTNCECRFIEIRKNAWFYLLEDGDAPKNAWDWREYATACGPFPSMDATHEYLRDNHANPGGYSESPLAEGELEVDLEKDPVLKKLIEQAYPPLRRRYY